ncbi:LmbE family protein [Lewinellaceae bacterium SD302]|nr:LmbE family protein [Lewinellaceae bacterium SD302]
MAAHPDDENTRLIAHFANVDKVETAYLSLTRGDGGQNLIASDIRELLGLTRTQELLAARRTDGGTQFFSRANDFGYSKHPDETFNIWDKDKVMADAVKVIRQWRPDVIVLRFDPRKPGSTHGHHTASAVVGMEAFEKAADPAYRPELGDAWQTKRIYWNAYTWRRDLADHINWDEVIKVNVGNFLPVLGEGTAEIAARSRSQHKSQGFGSSGQRGEILEDLELMAGVDKGENDNPFAGIDLSWTRVEGGRKIGETLSRVESQFDLANPAASVLDLLDAYKMIQELPESAAHWRLRKGQQVQEIIGACLGLYLSAGTDEATVAAGDSLQIEVEAALRSDFPAKLTLVSVYGNGAVNQAPLAANEKLTNGGKFEREIGIAISEDAENSGPYWLQKAGTLGMYEASEDHLIGLGESPDPLYVRFGIELEHRGEPYTLIYQRPVRQQFTDPVKGEQHQPLEILEPVFAELGESSYLFTESKPTPVSVKVRANRPDLKGTIELCTPNDWTVTPAKIDIELDRKGEEKFYVFELTPPAGQAQGMIVPLVKLKGQDEGYTRKLVTINHDHIPTQLASLDASVPVSKLDLKTAGSRIGYIMGAGDAIPEALRNVGYEVTLLDGNDIAAGDLSRYNAIVVGIRAYNTESNMANYQPKLMKYVEEGGTVVVQYNTNRRLKIDMTELGPYPLQLSRDRVTVEEAEVRLLAPDHPALNYPNKITTRDFDGWVQERGLYFPNNWSDEYTALLSSNDPGEPARDGGLLVTQHGEGWFVYTGYSFFRELPAGVPGAYRLFVNLISLGNQAK